MKSKIKNFLSKGSLLFLVLVVTFGYFFWPKVEMVSFKVPRGQIKIVTLPDSSEIILNAESSLKYDSTEFQQKREVVLCGEAYFKIKLGKPFFVKSDFVTTKTFGASFNVRFRGKKVRVSCLMGKVSVQANRNKYEVELASGYHLDLGELTNMLSLIENGIYVNIHSVLLVKDNKLVLEEYYPGRTVFNQFINFNRNTLPQYALSHQELQFRFGRHCHDGGQDQ